GARIDGQVESIEVQPGQHVTRDQVLIRLMADHYQAAVHAAEAQSQSAQKRWEAERIAIEYQHRQLPLDVEKCESLCRARQSAVNADLSKQAKAEREYDRMYSLVESHIASASDLDAASAERDSARAVVVTDRENLAAAESDGRIARVQLEGLK